MSNEPRNVRVDVVDFDPTEPNGDFAMRWIIECRSKEDALQVRGRIPRSIIREMKDGSIVVVRTLAVSRSKDKHVMQAISRTVDEISLLDFGIKS